jgi:hypothetical protein
MYIRIPQATSIKPIKRLREIFLVFSSSEILFLLFILLGTINRKLMEKSRHTVPDMIINTSFII